MIRKTQRHTDTLASPIPMTLEICEMTLHLYHQKRLFGREAIYVSSQACEDEFSLAGHSDDSSDLDGGQ